jgi:hypothetical protein
MVVSHVDSIAGLTMEDDALYGGGSECVREPKIVDGDVRQV